MERVDTEGQVVTAKVSIYLYTLQQDDTSLPLSFCVDTGNNALTDTISY